MLLSALIGAIVMVAQKYGSQHSSGIMFFTLLLCIDWLVFAVIVWRRGLLQPGAVLSRSTLKIIIATGITWGVGGALAYSAFSYTMSAYVGAALQIQVLLSIILGAVAFKEKEIKQRFLAGCIMLGGIVMVAIGTP